MYRYRKIFATPWKDQAVEVCYTAECRVAERNEPREDDGDDGALLDKEVLEAGADRGFAVGRLLLLLVTAREPASHLAAARLVRWHGWLSGWTSRRFRVSSLVGREDLLDGTAEHLSTLSGKLRFISRHRAKTFAFFLGDRVKGVQELSEPRDLSRRNAYLRSREFQTFIWQTIFLSELSEITQ